LFSGNVSELSVKEIETAFNEFEKTILAEDIELVDLLIKTNLASSKRQAREFVQTGAVALNGQKISDVSLVVTKASAIGNKYTILRKGKKTYALCVHE